MGLPIEIFFENKKKGKEVKKVIKMTLLSGPFADRIREIRWGEVEPLDLLGSCVAHQWHWHINYADATPEEAFFWLRAEIGARMVLATLEGRSMFFEGVEHSDPQEFEDAISSSGSMVGIERDDETGFWVTSGGPEPGATVH